jgi:protein arginine N-methyltransferase 1
MLTNIFLSLLSIHSFCEYIVEYTDMAKHAEQVMVANGVDHIVTVIQGAVEEIELPMEKDSLVSNDPEHPEQVVDIIISEWMGYFLLRESMLDSLIRARDKFMRPATGLMFPSHTTMYVAPVHDEQERRHNATDYAAAMSDWTDFQETTKQVYGVDMEILQKDFNREQKDYYMWSSRWTELQPEAVLAEPKLIKHYDMATCTLADSRGVSSEDPGAVNVFDFNVDGSREGGPISGVAGWFTADFKSRTDEAGENAPKMSHPAFLSTGPENGYTHWGQQTFYFQSGIPLLKGETTRLEGSLEMMRTKENARLYNCRIKYSSSRRKSENDTDPILMKSAVVEQVYQIP